MQTFWSWLAEGADHGSAVMVPVFEKKALILRRGPTAPWRPGFWNLPGGGIEDGESAVQAALRECEEEAGLRVTNVRPLGTWSMGGQKIHAFAGDATDGKASLKPNGDGVVENDQWRWVTVQDLGEFRFAEARIADVIRMALS